MKIEITYSKKNGAEVNLIDVPKKMDSVEIAAIIEEAIDALRGLQTNLLPSMDHV